jgi:excisionase family DNA binding protein
LGLIFFFAGLALIVLGKINLGPFSEEGRHVRKAGAVLATPYTLRIFFSLVVAIGTNGQHDEAWLVQQNAWIDFIEIIALVIAGWAAYMVLFRVPFNALSSRFTPHPPEISTNYIDTFPQVMTVSEAARYLKISDHDVLQLIDEGSIRANKDRHGYFTVTKQALDEFSNKETNQ